MHHLCTFDIQVRSKKYKHLCLLANSTELYASCCKQFTGGRVSGEGHREREVPGREMSSLGCAILQGGANGKNNPIRLSSVHKMLSMLRTRKS